VVGWISQKQQAAGSLFFGFSFFNGICIEGVPYGRNSKWFKKNYISFE